MSVVIHFRNAVRKKFLLEDTIRGKSFERVANVYYVILHLPDSSTSLYSDPASRKFHLIIIAVNIILVMVVV